MNDTTSEKTDDKVNEIGAEKVQKKKEDEDNDEASEENNDDQE